MQQTATCEGDSCEILPGAARGTLMGELNGEDLGIVSLVANASSFGMQQTVTVNISPLIPKHVWFQKYYWNVQFMLAFRRCKKAFH